MRPFSLVLWILALFSLSAPLSARPIVPAPDGAAPMTLEASVIPPSAVRSAPPAPRPGLQMPPAESESSDDTAVEHGETLEQVLRSLITNRANNQPAKPPAKPDEQAAAAKDAAKTKDGAKKSPTRSPDELEDGDAMDRAADAAYRALLDSEILGAAVRSVVSVEEAQGGAKSFALLGIGDFEISVEDVATIMIAENSTGISVDLQRAAETQAAAAAKGEGSASEQQSRQQQANDRKTLLIVLIKLLSLLDPSEWMFVIVLVGVVVVPLGALRLAIHMHRHQPAPIGRPGATP